MMNNEKWIIQKIRLLSKADFACARSIKIQLLKAGIKYFLHMEHTYSEYPRMLSQNHFHPTPC